MITKLKSHKYLTLLEIWSSNFFLPFDDFDRFKLALSFRDTKLVDKDSKEAQKYLKQQEEGSSNLKRKPGGLNSIMGVISGKVTKMGTLDKSKRDWDQYVSDTGIKEELQTHNRGKDGYVEKQMFLERSDLRRFEIEKAAREKTRKTLNR